jgi:hypothetical protein
MCLSHQIHLLRDNVGLLLVWMCWWNLAWHTICQWTLPSSNLRLITNSDIALSINMITHRKLLLHHLHLVLQLNLLLLLLLILNTLGPIYLFLNGVR